MATQQNHHISYTKLRDRYCRTLASTKAAFNSKEIESALNDSRAMFRISVVISQITTLIENCKTNSSKIDPLPISILAPITRNVNNLYYESSTLPARLKQAVIKPLLARSGPPVDDYASYRPISNLPYASKLLECHVSAQLRLHLQHNDIGDPFQSAYRPSHSVETASVCIQDDILRSLEARRHAVLVLLDLTAAFDTIGHDILLAELDRIGVRGVLTHRPNTVRQC